MSEEFQQWIRRKRKIIEKEFSVLIAQFRLTSIRSMSLNVFETALEGIFFAHPFVVLCAV
jgi:hypothetical protein